MAAKSSKAKLRIAISCSSNMNRSMEAHSFLAKKGFNVSSYGSGNQVKLPGPAIDKPNCYEFGSTTYEYIYQDLLTKDKNLYTNNGLLNMLDRNRRIKEGPQRFQDELKEFDVIICLEERVYDQVLDFLRDRPQLSLNPVHVINIDIEDNPEEATTGAVFVVQMCTKLEKCTDLDHDIDEALEDIENSSIKRNILHTICFY